MVEVLGEKMKSKQPKNQKMLFVFLVFGVGILSIIAFQVMDKVLEHKNSQSESTKPGKENKTELSALVKLTEIKPSDFSDTIRGVTGKIDVARAKLGFEISGVVETIQKDKGEAVKKGEILAELNKTDLILKEKYKRNSLEGSKIELEKAKKILEENREKAKTGFILETKLKDYELDVALKENKVSADDLEIEAASENIKKAELKAPFDGVVMERRIETGESLSNGRDAFVLLDINNIFADIEINEKKLSKIQPGQDILLKTNIYPDPIKGKIQSIVPAVQGKAMILSARAKLESTKLPLLPGMFVTGEIRVYGEKDALVLPLSALTKENDDVYVYLYNEKKNAVMKTKVSLGYMTQEEAVVKSGIKPGQKIVIESSQPLKDGMPVKVEEA